MSKLYSQPLSAYFFLVLAQVMVGINIVGSKYLVASMPILFILVMRFILAAALLFLLHRFDPHPEPISRHLAKLSKRDWAYLVAQALTAGALFNCLMIAGLRYTNANMAGIITSGLPAIIAVMSWIILKERFTLKKSACVGLATLGLLVISVDKFLGGAGKQSMLGNLLIFLSLLPEAAYYVLSKMYVSRLPIFLMSAVLNSINALVILPVFLFGIDWHLLHFVPFNLGILLVVGASSALFFVFWYLGSYRVDGVMASLSTAVMPVATVMVAWLALGEVITAIQLLGMGLVITSVVVYALK